MTATEASTPWGPIPLEDGPSEGTRERILDVALARFCAEGISAITMSQIAADAGISRVWLYRHFENRDAIVRSLIGRESRRFIAGLLARATPGGPLADRVVDAFDYIVEQLRSHQLLQRVLQTEPDIVAPFLASGTGPILQRAAAVAAEFLRAESTLSPADTRAVAETLLRLIVSVVVNNDTGIDFDDARQRRAYARRIIPRLLA